MAVSVLDFGADPTGAVSSHAAFSAALECLRDNRGGTFYVPAGRYKFTAPITSINFLGSYASGIRVVGDGDATELRPVGRVGQRLFQFHNAGSRISFADLSFVGEGEPSTVDVGTLVHASYCMGGLELERVTVCGIRSNLPGTISIYAADLTMRGCYFGGSAASGGAAVYTDQWRNVLIEDCHFIDYSKTHTSKLAGGNGTWIWLDSPNGDPTDATALSQGSAVIRMCRLDEGASPQIRIDPTENRVDRVLVEDCNLNVSGVTGGLGGVYLRRVDHARVQRTRCSWGNSNSFNSIAVNIVECDVAELEHVRAVAGAKVIRADALTKYVHLRDCTYGVLDSSAECTRTTRRGVTA